MPGRTPENAPQPADFVPRDVAKALLRATRAGTLATLDRNTGHPFGSLVNVATDAGGAPLILVSRLATHTANLEVDGRASLLLAETGKGDALAHPRLTVLGSMAPVAHDSADEPAIRRRFLARHPKSELYAGFADFSFWRMDVVSAHLNGGFARAADLDRGRCAHRSRRRAGAGRHRGRRHRAHERRSCRGTQALCHQIARRARRRLALRRPRSRRHRLAAGRHRIAACRFRSASPAPGPLRAVLKQLADEARAR